MAAEDMTGLRLARLADDYARTAPATPIPLDTRRSREITLKLRALLTEQHAASADAVRHGQLAETAASASDRYWHRREHAAALQRSAGLGPQIAMLQGRLAQLRGA